MLEVTKKRWTAIPAALLLLVGSMILPADTARASLSACYATADPNSVAANSTLNFQFQVQNTDVTPIQWIRVVRPSTNFTLQGASAGGWSPSVSVDQVSFSGGSIDPNDTLGFSINAAIGGTSESASWVIYASDDPGGAGEIACAGDWTVTVSGTAPPPINIFNITLSDLTDTSIRISWDTNIASNSEIDYGKTSSYGSAATSDDLVTHHSLQLTGLSPNSGYHYHLVSTVPSDNNSTTSSDNTFVTPPTPPPTPPPVIINNITNNITTGTTPGVVFRETPTEHIPPTVNIATNFSKPFKMPPTITGTAADNDAVARIDYSLNGGHDWLPVDKVTSKNGGKTVAYQFTPSALEDDNYSVVVRAIDASKNSADTPPVTMVIDRLPPQLGPFAVTYGPETLIPDAGGIVHLVAGSDYRLATNGVGGPTTVTLEANLTGRAGTTSSASMRTFTLVQNDESGLWNGLLSFKTGGTYQLLAKSVDGAGNRTTRLLATVAVTPPGHIMNSAHTAVSGAKLTLYYLEPSTQTWQVWDGRPYGQDNPQLAQVNGSYSLMVPEGKYYLKVEAKLHHTFVSNIFTVEQPLALTSVITLGTMAHLGPLHLPDINWRSQPLQLTQAKVRTATTASLVGTDLPDFQLPTTTGGTKRALDLAGRPTVLSMLATWSPDSQSQLPALAAAQTNRDVNVMPVFSQEHTQLVATYLATAGYSLTGLIDADGVLVPALQVGPVPQHIFVDRSGRIKKVMVGVLSREELLNQLGGL